MHVACVHHLDPPVLGFARGVLDGSGARVTHHAPYRGDALPALDDLDAAIVFGAEQSVRDLDRDPVMQAEAAWLHDVVADGIPVLGICFGAQLMSRALGGSVERLPRRMLTWDPLEPTRAASDDVLLADLPPGARALQWNEDGFEPPPGAVELLARRGQRGVGFRFGACAWGVQFHPEVDGTVLDRWYAGWPGALAEAGISERDAREADARYLPAQADLARTVFSRFLEVARRDAERRAAQLRAVERGAGERRDVEPEIAARREGERREAERRDGESGDSGPQEDGRREVERPPVAGR